MAEFITEFKRAIELDPNSADAHVMYAGYLVSLARNNEAGAGIKRVLELDPLSLVVATNAQLSLFMARQYDQVIQAAQKSIEMEPNFAAGHNLLGYAYVERGRIEEGLAELEKSTRLDDSPLLKAFMASAYARTGKRREAETQIEQLKEMAKRRYVCLYEIGATYLALGKVDTAFEWYEKAFSDRSDCMVVIGVDPRLDDIRSDPRLKKLIRRVGIPQTQTTAGIPKSLARKGDMMASGQYLKMISRAIPARRTLSRESAMTVFSRCVPLG